MAQITLDGVGKVYPGGTRAVKDVNLEIRDGEFLVLVGPSGCGKSTLLRMIAGLEEITEGKITIGDVVVNDIPSKDRDIAMVFQNYALYPHMSVFDNMAFGLKLRKMDKGEIRGRVEEAARILEIGDFLDRRPKALSGGQRQRVAMGRAIVREPKAFLMDEPLSNLDAKLRVQMRTELGLLHTRLGTTTVYVTHDQVEAMTLGHRVAVIRKGTLPQVASPSTLFHEPVNLFVAGFIGSPAMNMVTGRIEGRDGALHAKFGDVSLKLPAGILEERPNLADHIGEDVVIGVRPGEFEDVRLAPPGYDQEQTMEAGVDVVEVLGPETFVHFRLPVAPVITEDVKELLADTGASPESLGNETKFAARVSPDSSVRSGERVKLVVVTGKIHFFEPESGLRIT
ncbi:MAG: ABC transporter ATP-binding protein [Acidimicrobiia bacterium]